MEAGVSRAAIDANAGQRFTALRRQLGVSAFGMNQITLQPRERGRIHRHQRQEEVYLVLAGRLTILVEREQHVLGVGELIRVAPSLKRQLANAGSEPVIVLALGGAGSHEGRDGEAFEFWDDAEGRPPQEVPLPADLGASGEAATSEQAQSEGAMPAGIPADEPA